MSVKITDLGPVTLPLAGTEQFEVAISETESRRLSVADLLAAVGGLDATFVTVTANPNLANERVLTAGSGITIVDGGAGGAITINADVPPAGNLPTPTVLNSMLISDGAAAWLEAANLTYDNALSALAFAAVQGVGGGIIMQGALSTNYEVLTLRDQTGGNGFNLEFDYSLSASNHNLNFNSDLSGELLQLEADGVIRFLGYLGDPIEIDSTGSGRLLVQNGASLFIEEIAAAQADQAGYGQIWVRNDTPNVLMFTDDAGTDFEISTGGGFDPTSNQNITGAWTFTNAINDFELGPSTSLQMRNPADDSTVFLQYSAGNFNWGIAGTGFNSDFMDFGSSFIHFRFGDPLMLRYVTAAPNVAGFGQLYASGDNLFFRDDGGVETNLTAGGGGAPGGAVNSVQFNNAGAFGGFGTWDGSELTIPASQAAIILDETDGGGAAFIRLTSTTTSDSGIQIEFDSSTGTDARIRQVTSGGVLEDIWVTFSENAGVALRFNNFERLRTITDGVNIVKDDSTDVGNNLLRFVHANGTARALIGNVGNDLDVRSLVHGALMFFRGEDAGGTLRSVLQADPDAVTFLRGNTQIELQVGTAGDDVLTATPGGATILYYNAAAQFETDILGARVRDTLYVGNPNGGVIKINEQASADVDEAGFGQLWVRNDSPNNLMFTDDNGVDHLVAGTGAGGDISAGTVLITGTGFTAVANVSPEINTDYMVIASVEVTAPAADDMNIQFVIDTNARFYGTLTNTEDDVTAIIEGQNGEVVTNNVLVPTSGAATPAGTYVTIVGRLIMGATTGTMSLRCAKNADTGADGNAVRAAIKLIPLN